MDLSPITILPYTPTATSQPSVAPIDTSSEVMALSLGIGVVIAVATGVFACANHVCGSKVFHGGRDPDICGNKRLTYFSSALSTLAALTSLVLYSILVTRFPVTTPPSDKCSVSLKRGIEFNAAASFILAFISGMGQIRFALDNRRMHRTLTAAFVLTSITGIALLVSRVALGCVPVSPPNPAP